MCPRCQNEFIITEQIPWEPFGYLFCIICGWRQYIGIEVPDDIFEETEFKIQHCEKCGREIQVSIDSTNRKYCYDCSAHLNWWRIKKVRDKQHELSIS